MRAERRRAAALARAVRAAVAMVAPPRRDAVPRSTVRGRG